MKIGSKVKIVSPMRGTYNKTGEVVDFVRMGSFGVEWIVNVPGYGDISYFGDEIEEIEE